MIDALRIAGLVAIVLGTIAGLGLGILAVFWIRSGLKDLEQIFDL